MSVLYGFVSAGQALPLLTLAERAADTVEALRRNNDNLSAKIRVAMPAIVVSFDSSQQTIVAQPLIKEKLINRANGTIQWAQLPPILDVPVCFPQGGDFCLTMPISAGDEVLLVFNDMCMDSWFTSGGIQTWNDKRRHDLSDAFAMVGVNSLPNTISDIASNATELRSKDGATRVSVQGNSITLTVGGNEIVLDSSGIHLNAPLFINGDPYLLHAHGGVQSGGSITSGVVP